VNQGGACPWCVVQDITITHNIIAHVPMGIVMAPIEGPQSTNDAVPLGRVLVENDLIVDSNSTTWGGHGWAFELVVSDPPNMHDITIDHNTTFSNDAAVSLDFGVASDQMTNFQFLNNLQDCGQYGYFTQAGDAVPSFVTGAFGWKQNAVLGSCGGTGVTEIQTTLATAGFTSISGTNPAVTGNFQLLASSSLRAMGTDGQDIGVADWYCLNSTTNAALAGTYVQQPGGRCSNGN
jgi:hypothetical protein